MRDVPGTFSSFSFVSFHKEPNPKEKTQKLNHRINSNLITENEIDKVHGNLLTFSAEGCCSAVIQPSWMDGSGRERRDYVDK
jgi:hypothetical protein